MVNQIWLGVRVQQGNCFTLSPTATSVYVWIGRYPGLRSNIVYRCGGSTGLDIRNQKYEYRHQFPV